MRKETLVSLYGAVLVFSLIFAPLSRAHAETDVMAQVSIGSATVSQNDRSAIIRFTINNYGSAISGIKTSIVLLSKDLSQTLDQKVIGESVSLANGEKKEIVYSYNFPTSLSGTFYLAVRSTTGANLPLATMIFPKTISTKSSASGLLLDQSSCFLKVGGESADKKYNLEQGVDVSSSEKLILTCTVKNLDKNQLDAKTVSSTYQRSRVGKVISESVPGTIFAIKALETKKIELPIALPTDPQAYDTFVKIEGASGISSNEVRVHFVVQGQSATVQNVSLDKVSYSKGEVAVVTLNWTPSADSFPGSRIGSGTAIKEPKAIISLLSGNNSCAKDLVISLDSNKFTVTGSANIESNCVGVVANTKIVSGDKEFYSSNYNVPIKEDKATPVSVQAMLIIALAIVVVVSVLFFFIKSKKAQSISIFLFLLGFGLLNFQSVSADTVTWNDKSANTLSGTINMVRDWNVGDDIIFSGDFSNTYQWCGNGATKKITLGYQVMDSAGKQIAFKNSISGPMISESLGVLAAGDYTLKTYFGDSVEYVVGSYIAGMCPEMVEQYISMDDYPYYETITIPSGKLYACQIPVYVVSAISGIASLDIPFKVNSGSNPPNGNLTCTGDVNTYSWSTGMGACGTSFTPKVPAVQCGPTNYLSCAVAPINVTCKRDSDNSVVADALCNTAMKPNIIASQICNCKCGS